MSWACVCADVSPFRILCWSLAISLRIACRGASRLCSVFFLSAMYALATTEAQRCADTAVGPLHVISRRVVVDGLLTVMRFLRSSDVDWSCSATPPGPASNWSEVVIFTSFGICCIRLLAAIGSTFIAATVTVAVAEYTGER